MKVWYNFLKSQNNLCRRTTGPELRLEFVELFGVLEMRPINFRQPEELLKNNIDNFLHGVATGDEPFP